jgi:hypothetical protein
MRDVPRILEEENHTGDINYDMHNRTFGVNGVIAPKEVISFDFAYNFSAFQQSNNICFIGTMVPSGSFTCNNDPTLLETLGNYNSHTNYGEFSLVLKPEKRVAARVGYGITNVSGSTLILNTLQPLGPLASQLQQPLAAIPVDRIGARRKKSVLLTTSNTSVCVQWICRGRSVPGTRRRDSLL